MSERVLVVATVPSMIGQFNISNIKLLLELGYDVDVATNFLDKSVWPVEQVEEFKMKMEAMDVNCFQIDFSRRPLGISKHIKSYKELVELINLRKYSFIHTHTPVASALTRIANRKGNSKIVYTAHGFHFFNGAPLKNWIVYYPIEWYLSRYTDVIITINKEDYFRAKKNFKAKKIMYIPGVGIRTELFYPDEEKGNKKREELGIEKSQTILFSVGELSNRKNHMLIIETIAKMKRSEVHYLIAGKGNMLDRLTKRAEELGVSSQIHFLGYRQDVADLYRVSDIFVFPSLQEGLPVALMEAMAAGLPVVCSDIRGNRDVIEDGQGGILCNPHSVDSFVSGIEKILDGNLSDTMRNVNLAEIKKYDLSIIEREMRSLYSDMRQ